MKEAIYKINHEQNMEKKKEMLDSLNAEHGTQYGFLSGRVVRFENPEASTAEKYAHCHDVWAELDNEEEYVSRPQWNNSIRGHRAEVWFYRYRSAWDLASIVCGNKVTQTEYDAALKLLDSIQRYALADAREWEMENSSERYCNSAYHKQREAMLDKRRAKLQARLDRYGLRLENYGLYPQIENADRCNMYMLHYFD